jgi:hypothetical protein
MMKEDPLGKEIDLFRLKKEQAQLIENLFVRIKTNYENSGIKNDALEINEKLRGTSDKNWVF